MKKKSDIIEFLNEYLKNNPENFPFNGQFWKFEIVDIISGEQIKLGRYNAILRTPDPFYKPYSKIVNLNFKINE